MIDLPNPVNAVRKRKRKKPSLGCTIKLQFEIFWIHSKLIAVSNRFASCMLQLTRHQSRGARPLYGEGEGAQRFAEHAKTCVLSTCPAAFVYPQLLWLLFLSPDIY